jgi:hypothetical protein
MPRISPVAVEIRNELIIKSASVDDALSRACHDIYVREMHIRDLESRLRQAELDNSYGFKQGRFTTRTCPYEAIRKPKPQPAAICDTWIATGKEAP